MNTNSNTENLISPNLISAENLKSLNLNDSFAKPLLIRELTIDEAYEMTGGHGRYQILVALSVVLSQITSMAYIFSLPLFQIFPVVLGCPNGICEDKETACKYESRYYADKHFNFITEFDLLCHDFKASLITSSYPVGFLFGSIIFTSVADSLGRIPSILIGQSGMFFSVLFLTYFPHYETCLVCSCFCGFFSAASFYPGYTYSYDNNHSKFVLIYATFVGVVFAFGEIIVAGIMWYGVRWKTMCYVFMGLAMSYMIFPFFMTEAPRYFYSKGNLKAAIKGFKNIAKINGVEIKEKFTIKDTCKVATTAETFSDKIKLLFTKWVLIRVLLCALLFFSCGFIYYGLSLNVQKFKGNVYINAIINAIAEIIADITACIVATKFGPKYPLMGCFSFTALSLILQYLSIEFVELSSFSMYMGKFFISGSFTLIYTMGGKLFPTSISSTAIGILGFIERLGATLSPIAGNIQILLFSVAICCGIGSAIVSIFVVREEENNAK